MKATPWILALALSFAAYAGMENPDTGEKCQGIDCLDMNDPGPASGSTTRRPVGASRRR